MKFLLTAIGIALLVSCQKESENIPPNSLMGPWKWLSTSGGFSGGGENASATHYQLIDFVSSTYYKWYENDSIYKEGTYSLTFGESMLTQEDGYLLELEGFAYSPFFVTQRNDSLILSQDAYDGQIHIFQKL